MVRRWGVFLNVDPPHLPFYNEESFKSFTRLIPNDRANGNIPQTKWVSPFCFSNLKPAARNPLLRTSLCTETKGYLLRTAALL